MLPKIFKNFETFFNKLGYFYFHMLPTKYNLWKCINQKWDKIVLLFVNSKSILSGSRPETQAVSFEPWHLAQNYETLFKENFSSLRPMLLSSIEGGGWKPVKLSYSHLCEMVQADRILLRLTPWSSNYVCSIEVELNLDVLTASTVLLFADK